MKYHYLTACLVVLMACESKEVVPESILEPNQMVDIWIDVHLNDARVRNLRLIEDSAVVVMRHLELYTYEQHGVSEDSYLESMQWYLSRPEQMKNMYAQVVDSLNLIQEEAKPSSEVEQPGRPESVVPNQRNPNREPEEEDASRVLQPTEEDSEEGDQEER